MERKRCAIVCFLVLIFALSGCGIKKTQYKPEESKKSAPPLMPQPVESSLAPSAPPAPAVPAGPASTETTTTPAANTAGDILIADFEGWPNNLGGEVGVYGALEPDWEKVSQQPISWAYEPTTLGYTPENIHSGNNSFRLVNGVGVKPEFAWGSFSMDLGPTIDITVVPKKVESLDASAYQYLVFWVKGAKGGEKMEFVVRDSHALNYIPQVKYKLPDAANEWQKIVMPLSDISGKVDLTRLDNIGIAFGKDVGNATGDTIFIDDFAFTNNK